MVTAKCVESREGNEWNSVRNSIIDASQAALLRRVFCRDFWYCLSPMKDAVNPELTRKIAHLSRLQLAEDEVERYTAELSKILDFVAQLSEVNVEGVEPAIHGIPLDARFREDEAVALSEEEAKRIVSCSESSLYEQYKVPQVIGGE